LNPLLHQGLFELILRRATGEENLDEYIFGHPGFGGWLAYSRGDFKTAVDRYGRAIKETPNAGGLHWWRGRAFLLVLAYDSALAELRAYREATKSRQEKQTWVFLQPHELADYSIGEVEEIKGDSAKAREEYENALLQDLSYVPAHVALARLAVARHDTASALRELDLATQDADADRCYTYGVLLWASRRAADAATQFGRAIHADSDYAPPYLSLGYLVEASGDDSLAAVLYRGFLVRAPKTLGAQLSTARQHLAGIAARKGTH
jgi:tetratricopeptide (TPR) repeat protein